MYKEFRRGISLTNVFRKLSEIFRNRKCSMKAMNSFVISNLLYDRGNSRKNALIDEVATSATQMWFYERMLLHLCAASYQDFCDLCPQKLLMTCGT